MTITRYRLTVKGNPEQARAVVISRFMLSTNPPLMHYDQRHNTSYLDLYTDDYVSLAAWYAEDTQLSPPEGVPFPVGALLFYSKMAQACCELDGCGCRCDWSQR